jgi:hypothetical protein
VTDHLLEQDDASTPTGKTAAEVELRGLFMRNCVNTLEKIAFQ